MREDGRGMRDERQKSEITPVEHPGRGPGSTGQGGQRSEVKPSVVGG